MRYLVTRLSRILNRIYFIFYNYAFINKNEIQIEKIGDTKGGWYIPTSLINGNSICYSGGVGDNISFDLELIRRFRCNVFAFDPTPRAINYLEEKSLPDKFSFHKVGLWNENTELKFYQPKVSHSTNFSIKNLENTDEYIVAKCKTLKAIMEELEHSHIDLLKIDIEGAEYEVIDNMIHENISPEVICVEFDQPTNLLKMINYNNKIINLGYSLIKIDIFNFTYKKSNL